jgi:spore maturation protein SpmB
MPPGSCSVVLATACSTLAAVLVAKLLRAARSSAERASVLAPGEAAAPSAAAISGRRAEEPRASGARRAAAKLVRRLPALLAFALLRQSRQGARCERTPGVKRALDTWLLPVLMASIVMFGFARRVKVYDAFIAGAREGFEIAVMIIPFLVAILVGVAMLDKSGALGALIAAVAPVTSWVGFPAEALPMALIRPLSGSGAMAVMTQTMQTHGPDSFTGFLVSVISGSTETTFYVLALYFGSVGVRAARHTVLACLAADLAGIAAALVFSRIFF